MLPMLSEKRLQEILQRIDEREELIQALANSQPSRVKRDFQQWRREREQKV